MGLSLLLDALNVTKDPFGEPRGWVVGSGVLTGAVFGLISYQDDIGVASLTDELGAWIVYGIAVAYAVLIFGLVRGTRWIKHQARLVPQIGDQVPRPSEEYWSPSPIIAWRSWTLSDRGLIGAWRTTWTQSHLTAHCKAAKHHAPDWNCRCGIYGLKEIPQLLDDKIIGLVELTGTVIEHEHGYRAEEAKITSLWIDGTSITDEQRRLLSETFSDAEIQSGHPAQPVGEQRQKHG